MDDSSKRPPGEQQGFEPASGSARASSRTPLRLPRNLIVSPCTDKIETSNWSSSLQQHIQRQLSILQSIPSSCS